MDDKENILITGNAGFIGSYFTEQLASSGKKVYGLDINRNNLNINGCCNKMGSILDKDAVSEQMSDCDLIIHLAARHHEFIEGPQKGLKISSNDYYETNVKGTSVVIEAATDMKVHNLIFFSTVAVYGNNMPSHEDTELLPVDDYGKTKAMAEKLVIDWADNDSKNRCLIIRPVVVFGINNWANVYNLINSIARNRFLPVGNGINKKSMAYIANLFEATMFAWKNMNGKVEIYNYSDYPILETRQINELIFKALNKRKPKFVLPYSIAYIGSKVFDLGSKILGKELLLTGERIKKYCSSSIHYSDRIRDKGFIQKYRTEDGLKEMIDWYKSINQY